MRLNIEELEQMSSKDLYDQLDTSNSYFTKAELNSLFNRRKMRGYVSQSATKDEVRNALLHELSIEIIHSIISPGTEKRYIDIDIIKDRSTEYKVDFIENYGKYLPEYELRKMLRSDFGKDKSYKEYLMNDYLSCCSLAKEIIVE